MKFSSAGFAIIDGDAYLSNDIEAAGRLDVARDFFLPYREYIPEGGIVLDIGACLGDSAATFSEFVGPTGWVIAFEPNPPVYACLEHNVKQMHNVITYPVALGATETKAEYVIDHHNIGASRLTGDGQGSVHVLPLDKLLNDMYIYSQIQFDAIPVRRLDFIKMDAEGYEPLILAGAKDTIMRFRPVILTEINPWMLGKLGFTPDDIYLKLEALGYNYPRFDGPHGDILCVPKERA